MPLSTEQRDFDALSDRLRDADAVTAKLMSELVGTTCRRHPSVGQAAKTARIERLIGSQAWTDARITRIYGGATEVMKEIVGRSMELG